MDQTLSFPRYDSYKESGVKWIDDIPTNWAVLPFKALFQMSTEKNGKIIVGEMLSVSGYRGIEVKRYEHEEQKRSTKDLVDYRVVRKGQLVVNTMWLNYAGLGVSEHEGHVSPAYRSYRISNQLHGRYAHYLLRSHVYVDGYTGQMQGIRPNSLQIKNCDFRKFPILLPKMNEQQLIANFLDQKTTEIDVAIAKKQRLIKLLKEQKAILINQAVTKGLNPDVSMRDSGVEWIGEVPEHWGIKKNRELFVERKEPGADSLPILSVSLHTGVSDAEQDASENIRAKVRIEDKTSYRRVYPGDIAFNMMRAWQGAVGVVKTDGQVSPAYIIASTCDLIDGEYFEYQYRISTFIGQMDRFSKGITDFRKRLYWNEFKQLVTIVPPVAEQKIIVKKIGEIAKSIDQIVEMTLKEIEQIKEYRSVLISEVVTGKIKL